MDSYEALVLGNLKQRITEERARRISCIMAIPTGDIEGIATIFMRHRGALDVIDDVMMMIDDIQRNISGGKG